MERLILGYGVWGIGYQRVSAGIGYRVSGIGYRVSGIGYQMVINIDLIAATKKHLQFLEAIDDNGKLYNGPLLERAVFRYKYCWLPLLAKHKDKVREWQLVVPLDCEWIWHCHRLNPVRYMADCKELFGRILDPSGMVKSSIEGTCKKETEKLWNKIYPKEPYEVGSGDRFDNDDGNKLIASESTKYDLVSAVKRQSSFYYQRYKGFLHLIRRNMEKKSNQFCVPTYDIDLIWHTHQLHPLSYCNDTMSLLGNILDHDDNDFDRTKGQKLDVGFTRTTKQWAQMFSSTYWRVGSMYTDMTPLNRLNDLAQSSGIMFVEGNNHFNIYNDTEEPQALIFHCEPHGDLLFELIDGSSKSCLISLSELDPRLASPKWLEFETGTN
ncbi:hypothetical protein Ccrd_014867 [Cynara cardunculus var. scolymus]|uniref:GRDP C2 domain-containing protein n=1 Tax=Cynara cardunculus var. scolymus TaxID=59895 RepID=A0A103YCW7_CYNCS|nr:hypothetical protein Ccrd_014867 [Cynara cardunculus var. scolymus]